MPVCAFTCSFSSLYDSVDICLYFKGAEVKVKVFTLPTSVSELLDDDSEDDDDDDFTGVSDDRKSSAKPGTIKVINFKILDDGKPSEDERGGRSSAFSQIFGQFFVSVTA